MGSGKQNSNTATIMVIGQVQIQEQGDGKAHQNAQKKDADGNTINVVDWDEKEASTSSTTGSSQ